MAGHEEEARHAGGDASLADVGEAVEKVEHPRVLGEHVGSEAFDALGLRGLEQGAKEHGAKALALEVVLYDKGDLGGARVVGGFIAGHRDQLGGRTVLGYEGKPPAVVDGGEQAGPIWRQTLHDAEEALVGGVAAEPVVEFDQPRGVFGLDGTEPDLGSVREKDSALERSGIL